MQQRRWWVFDRPVLHDPLLWAGLATGMVLLLLSPPAVASRWYVVLGELVLRMLAGVVLAGAFGGFVRNLVRGLEPDAPPPPQQHRRSSMASGRDDRDSR